MNPSTEIAVRPNGAEVVRHEFGAVQTMQQHETAAAAVAAREQAAVQARYIVAMQRPRNVEQFRKRLMDMCLKPGFAAKAEYAKPLGKKWNPKTSQEEDQFATGPSIRFIESALQAYGNIYPEVVTVFDNQQARICRVTVTDLETNISYTTEVMITKVVERKAVDEWKNKKKTGNKIAPPGRTILGERLNSSGDTTYLCVATDDEVLVKQNALLSKALRTNAQRLLPYDIVEECIRIAKQTVANKDAADPDAAKREIIDYFANIGVEPVDLEAYLGKSLAKPLQPADMAKLRNAYKAVQSGESTWEDLMEGADGGGSAEQQEAMRQQKIADAEAKLAAQRQQNNPNTTTDGGGEQAGDAQSRETGSNASTPGTTVKSSPASTPGPQTSSPVPDPDATKQTEQTEQTKMHKPVFGRRNQ